MLFRSSLGHSCEIVKAELNDDIVLDDCNMVYIGHGKVKNLAAASKHFIKYADIMMSAIESGKVFLVTGNARLLFGKTFENFDGSTLGGIGIFDYTGTETNKVFVSDVLSTPINNENLKVYGFINRTAHMEHNGENPYPWFKLITGSGDIAENGKYEGTHYKNFYGTWQVGPLLMRNPEILREILRNLIGNDADKLDLSLEQKALDLTLKEFETTK